MCHMAWDLIWGASSFYKSKTKINKRGGKSAIWPNWCCQQSITVLSTPPSSMGSTRKRQDASNNFLNFCFFPWTKWYFRETIQMTLPSEKNFFIRSKILQLLLNSKGCTQKTQHNLLIKTSKNFIQKRSFIES